MEDVIKKLGGMSAAELKKVIAAAEGRLHELSHKGPAGDMTRPGTPIEQAVSGSR